MRVRLIASDLDGTLFGADHRPGPRAVAALNAARDAGIHIVAVTGRSWFAGLPLATSTGARLHQFIGSNGGHRVEVETNRMVERATFATSFADRLASRLRAALGPVGFGYELEHELVWDQRFVDLSPVSIDGRVRTATASAPGGAVAGVGKAFVAHPELAGMELAAAVLEHVAGEAEVTTSGAPFVELTPPGADKGTALARLAGELGIDAREVVAFGDNHNDVTMLRWAGRGVAMGNAVPEVKAAADEVTASNTDDGVARVVEELLSR